MGVLVGFQGRSMSDTTFFIEPKVVMLPRGGCLAVSEDSSPLRIGVVGKDAIEATMRFQETLKRWKEIYETEECAS